MNVIRSIWDAIIGAVVDLFYELVGDALGLGIVVGIMAVLIVPVYFLLKKLGFGPRREGRLTTYSEDLQEFLHPPKPTAEQLEKARQIQQVGDKVRVVFRYVLCFVFVLVTGLAIFLFKAIEKDASKSFLQGYFGILYLLFLLFVVGCYLAARPWAQRSTDVAPDDSDKAPKGRHKPHTFSATLGMSLGSKASDFNFDWSAGEVPPAGEIPKSVESPIDFEIDDSKLIVAHAYMTSGQTLDSVCGLLNPEFGKWSPDQQRAYRDHLSSRLSAMKWVDES